VKRLRWPGVSLLLCLLLAQMAFSSLRKSATFDEPYHLGAGYAYLRTGDPRLSWEHPPLVDGLAALPLLLRSDVVLPLDHPTWEQADIVNFGDMFLWQANFDRAPELVVAGRWPVMGLAMLLGLALFLALRHFASEPAAWLGLTLFTLDPNIVGNGRQVTTDLGLTCFFFIAMWRLGAYLSRPTAPNLVLAGLTAGLTLCAKFSGVLVGPAFLLVTLLYQPADQRALPLSQRAAALARMGLLALAVVWAAYRFEVGPITEAGIPLPFPTYWRGMAAVYRRVQAGTPTFFLGRPRETGVWYYFPIIFALKTPLPTLILLGLGLVRVAGRWRQDVLWLIPAAVVFAAAIASPLNMSYRYVLPALPFAIALAAASVPLRHHIRLARRAGLTLLVIWAVVSAARIYPHHLSFVNELGGRPENAYRLFSDADWGQDLVGLQDYLATQNVTDVGLSYFGSADPAAYGLSFHHLPAFRRVLTGPDYLGYNPYTPPPGVYAISTTSLQLGLLYQHRDLYAVFRDREPDARIGYSIHIYKLTYPPDMPLNRAVVVGPAVADLPPETLGVQPGYRLVTKWAGPGAFVLAAGGPARYLVEATVPPSSVVKTLLTGSNPLADARPLLENLPGDPVPTTPGGEPTSLPASFDGGPALAGYELAGTIVPPGQAVELITYWRVEETLEPALSVFVHLLDADGAVLSQWDGWPVAFSGLEPEDIVVLHHPLTLPDDVAPGIHTLQVGLYRSPNGPRLLTSGADRLLLPFIEVSE
jgi:hypothetical protein